MSWQDDPVVSAPSSGSSGWQSDPIVEAPSALESAGHAVVNNLPFGGQMAATAKGLFNDDDYSKNLSDWNAQTPIDKTAHPVAYGTGAVAGAAAPLLIPGVGEAMEAAPFATNAAIGAADALGNTDLTKDPANIAKQGAEGALIGGTVGKAANAIGGVLSPAANIGKRIESNATANVLNVNPRGIMRLSKGLKNPEDVMQHVNEKLNDLIPNWLKIGDTGGSKYDTLAAAHQNASNTIGQVIDQTANKTGGKLPEIDSAIQDLKKEASVHNGLTSDKEMDAQKELNDVAFKLEQLQKSGQMNFNNLYEVKKGIGESFKNPNYVNPGVDKAYGIVSDAIDKILDRTNVPNSVYKNNFNRAKETFKLTSELLPAMKRGVAKEVAGTGGGLTNAGLGAAALFGHPAAAALGYAGKTAVKLAAPDLPQNLAYKAINASKKLPNIPQHTGKVIPQEIIDFVNSQRNQQ